MCPVDQRDHSDVSGEVSNGSEETPKYIKLQVEVVELSNGSGVDVG